MAFRDSDIAELFTEQTSSHNLSIGSVLEAKLSIDRRRALPPRAWCVVQCRLCASEHPTEQSLSGHWHHHHHPLHEQATRIHRELKVSTARALRAARTAAHRHQRDRLERRIALLSDQLSLLRLELARLG